MFEHGDARGQALRKTDRDARIARAFSDAQSLLQKCKVEYLHDAIMTALQAIGQAMGADRAYIFRIKQSVSVDNTHEWCAAGIRPLKAELQDLPYDMGEPFWQAFRASKQAFMLDISMIPVGSAFHKLLEEHEIKSLLASSLWCDGDMIGLVGLDFVREHRRFTDLEGSLMQGFAASVGIALNLAEQASTLQRAQSELRLERARIEAMVVSLPELLVETDNDGIITAFKQGDPLVFALNPDEVIGRPADVVLSPDLAAIVRKAMKQVDLFGWSPSFAYTLPFPSGDKRFTLTATRRHHDDPRTAHGYLFIVRDITESYTQDKRIRQLGRVAELSNNIIILTDKNRHVTWMNPASVARTGYTLKTAQGKRPSDILHLYDAAPDLTQTVCHALDKGQSINAEFQARSRRGISYWLDLSVQPFRSPDGYIQGYLVVGVDITSHKLAEARALRDKIQAMEITREGIAILNPDGRFSYLNCALRAILGVGRGDDVSGLIWHELVAPAHIPKLTAIFTELMSEWYWTGEVMLPASDGADAWYELSLTVQDDGSIFVLVRNVTARRLAQADRQRSREQLQIVQSRELMSQLAGGLAHDFANILAAIMGSVDIVKPKASPDMLPSLDRIQAAGRQGRALVGNLMRLGRMKSAASTADLQDVLRQSVELVRPGLGKEISVLMDFDDKAAATQVDATEMMQGVINLMMNAADAIRQKGAPNGRIALRMAAKDSLCSAPKVDIGKVSVGERYVVIDISDTGTGITHAVRPEIFKPYFTTKGAEGTGLGLAIVAHIVTSRSWGLQVVDAAKGGTIMRLYLPAMMPDTNNASEPMEPAAQPLAGRNVLLVDSDDWVLQNMAGILSLAGAEVVSCTDPRDALDAMREDPQAWDTVLADQNMTLINVQDLARELRAINRNLQIFVTGTSHPLQFANESDSQRITARISKSISGAELIAVLTGTDRT